MALIATPGAANANSYSTLAELESYFSNRVGAGAWDDLSAQQEEAAIQATLILDQHDYLGCPVTEIQALKWPRQLNEAGDLIRNYAINVIPAPIKHAHAEVVLALLTVAASGTSGTSEELKSADLGPLTLRFGATSVQSETVFGLPIEAVRFLSGLRLQSVLA